MSAIWSSPQGTVWVVGTFGVAREVGEGFARVEAPAFVHAQRVWGTGDDDVWIPDSGSSTVAHGTPAGFARTMPLNGSGVGNFAGTGPTDVWGVHQTRLDSRVLRFDGATWNVAHTLTNTRVRTAIAARPGVVWLLADIGDDRPRRAGARLLECTIEKCRTLARRDLAWIFGAPGDVWGVGTDGAWLRHDGARWRRAPGAGDVAHVSLANRVHWVAPDEIWLAGPDGVVRFDGKRWLPGAVDVDGEIEALARGRAALWVLTRSDRARRRLWRISDGAAVLVGFDGTPTIRRLIEDDTGLWVIGTDDDGPLIARRTDGAWAWVPNGGSVIGAGVHEGGLWIAFEGDPRSLAGMPKRWDGSFWQPLGSLGNAATAMVRRAPTETWTFALSGTSPTLMVPFRSIGPRGWNRETSFTTAPIDVAVTAGGEIWALDAAGAVHHFDGAQWRERSPPGGRARTLLARARDDVWAAGDAGTLARFDGSVWRPVATATTATLRALVDWRGLVRAFGDAGTARDVVDGVAQPAPAPAGDLLAAVATADGAICVAGRGVWCRRD